MHILKRKMLVTLLCITVVLSSTTACGAKKDTTIAETKTATMTTETVATIDTKISMKPSTVMNDDVALTENATVVETKNMTVPTDRVDGTIAKPITVDTMIGESTAETEPVETIEPTVTQTETVTEVPTENVTMTETPVEYTNDTTSPADEEEMDHIDAVACEDEMTGIITTDDPVPDPEYAPSNDTECAEETNAMNM